MINSNRIIIGRLRLPILRVTEPFRVCNRKYSVREIVNQNWIFLEGSHWCALEPNHTSTRFATREAETIVEKLNKTKMIF